MTPISIPCPHCGAVLKVRDPKMVGHRAKCPKCAQRFLLEEPETVGAAASGSVQGTNFLSPATPAVEAPPLANWQPDSAPRGAAERMQALRKKNRRRTLVTACISAGILLAGGLAGLYVYHDAPRSLTVDEAVDIEAEHAEDVNADADAGDDHTSSAAQEIQPIDLQYIPAGTRIAIHLRPAELWKPDSQGEEFRYCLGPISEFLSAKIRELSKRDPAQIREALFCLISGERGTAPDLAAVFHLTEDAKKSELMDQFAGRRAESQHGTPFYVTGDERAYLFPDLKTIAVCPAKLAEEMVFAIHQRNPTSEGILALLPMTDRSRPVTVLLEPVSTRIDAEFLLPPTAVPLLERFLDWFGPDGETIAWSLRLQQDFFRSELIVRNQGGRESRVLERQIQRNLNDLAGNILHVVQQFSPQELGKRQVIGRFPAMMKAFTLATRTETGPRWVKLETRLPERAAPNLALGALLAWDESTRTALKGKSPSVEPVEDKPDNTPIAEKLKRKITVEFKKTPLHVAFETIAEEIKANVIVDGEGLKLGSLTKNMEQNFVMEDVPAINIIEKIMKQPLYEKMCLVVDETKNSLRITSYPDAEQKGLMPYEFPK